MYALLLPLDERRQRTIDISTRTEGEQFQQYSS